MTAATPGLHARLRAAQTTLFARARRILASRLARSAAGAFALNIASNALALLTALVLARALGPADYGVYALALVWANILGFVAGLGFPQLIVREIARVPGAGETATATDTATRTSDLLATSWRLSLAAALALGAAAALLGPWLLPGAGTTAHLAFAAGMLMIAPIAIQRLQEAVVLGAHRPVTSLLPERVVRPITMFAAIGVLALAGTLAGHVHAAVLAQVMASLLTLATAVWLARCARPAALATLRGRFDPAHLRQALPYLVVGLTTLLATRLDVVMLGLLSDTTEVGQYRLAAQIAAVALLVATGSQAILQPEISRNAGAGTLPALRPQIVRYAIAAGSVTALGAVAMVIGFHLIEPLVGPGFVAAQSPLIVLLLAYAIVALLFPALPLLTMTGNARHVGWANIAALALNAALNLALIPRLGGLGAALATLASLTVLYALHVWNVWRLGLLTAR
jgi:O-antigen/teichoic acid export membrane protein